MKLAVVLFNLGGPASLSEVKPFLKSLFSDKHIIRLPAFLRYPLAWFIAHRRTPKAQKIYESIGGKSPLRDNTQRQAKALEEILKKEGMEAKVFVAMRHAPPLTKDVMEEVKAYNPEHVVLLPLYPQFSTTTTLSSFKEWQKYAGPFKEKETSFQCCYFDHPHFIVAHRQLIHHHLDSLGDQNPENLVLLFSAHGLPEKIIEDGDPYAWQVEVTVQHIMEDPVLSAYSYGVCYQSKVGRRKWLGPSLEASLEKCVNEKKGVVVVPITFVSEHSETLFELDIQYQEWAKEKNMVRYSRVPALAEHPLYMETLAAMTLEALSGKKLVRKCPMIFQQCVCA